MYKILYIFFWEGFGKMKKRLAIDELQKGRLYSDADGVETLQYIGGYGAGDLSEFIESD